jgi:glycine dehydrogenase
MIADLASWLASITGYDAVSLQPNAGSQGEFAGLMAIRAYHQSRGDSHRVVCIIPESAHGTNAASAVMCGMLVVVVKCDDKGDVDLSDLGQRIDEHRERLAAVMITYPSTHGVFEVGVRQICEMVHEAGGQVYVDGANMNALVGVAAPANFGADVSHLNLHKTFCIPHGGGGPGVGPIGVKAHLAPFLPTHPLAPSQFSHLCAQSGSVGPVSGAPFGSAGVLSIPWAYIALMGSTDLQNASLTAILNANYLTQRLGEHYPVLYTNTAGLVAHECVLDIRPITAATGVTAEDIAKRLMDYGFHAPTMSWPVAGTLMVEPTESENLAELNRFIAAMAGIRAEIKKIESGAWQLDESPLRRAPHTAEDLLEDWQRPYTREEAVYPMGRARSKYWPPVNRIDAAFGDRNLVCACPPVSAFTT